MITDMLRHLRVQIHDVQHFGPAVLGRALNKADAGGYSIARTRFGNFYLRRSETDMRVLRQVFISREYDLDRFPQGKLVRAAYESALQRGKAPLIIDAGANAGFAARFFAIAYPEARILSVEPDRANAAICRMNTATLPQVEVFEAAIGSQAGYVAVEHTDGHAWASRTHRAETGLPIVTINDLTSGVADSELLIVKVDIEGFEADLFAQATEWISETCVVIAELHDWMLPGSGSSATLQRAMLAADCEMLISGENLIWVRKAHL